MIDLTDVPPELTQEEEEKLEGVGDLSPSAMSHSSRFSLPTLNMRGRSLSVALGEGIGGEAERVGGRRRAFSVDTTPFDVDYKVMQWLLADDLMNGSEYVGVCGVEENQDVEFHLPFV